MLKDEFRPIDGKVLTIGRSPKEKIYMVPKAVLIYRKERAEKLSQIFSSWQQKEGLISWDCFNHQERLTEYKL